MHNISLFIKKRWLMFFVVAVIASFCVFRIVENKKLYYKAEARIVFIGKEGIFSPEAEARRIKEQDFLEKAADTMGIHNSAYINNNLLIDFEKQGVLLIGFVSEEPRKARDIVNLISNNFVNERKALLRQLEQDRQKNLQLISDDIMSAEANVSKAERSLRESRQKNLASDKRRSELKTALDESRAIYQHLLRTFTEKHPDVVSVKSKIDMLNEQLQAVPDASSEYERLQKNIDSQKLLLGTRKNEYQKMYEQIQGQSSPWQAEIEKEAVLPETPIGLSRQDYYFWGMVIIMLTTFLLCIFIEVVDNRIYTAEEAEKKLGLPVIADIGKISAFRMAMRKNNVSTKASRPDNSLAGKKIEQLCTHLKIETFKGSMAGKIILVTGPDIKTGKSFIAYNLALACARNGENVLLVDANIRYPAFNMFFNIDSHTKGFSDLIRGSVEHRESVKNVTDLLLSGALNLKDNHAHELDHLKILLAGSSIENPSRVLESDRIKKTLRELSSDYGTLVIDSPNLKNFPSVINLASASDLVLLVAAKRRTRYPAMKESIKKITGVKSGNINVVLAHV
jgi:Mrp family chromosome partitioning ATPase/capsular polysaccharide biosynthesis protein